ncbi:MAG TPA: hypothetical protein VGC57_13575, partial [Cellulomonas sp.]
GLTVVVGAGAHGIATGAVREGSWGEEVVEVADVDEAAALLGRELRAGDVVLVKSSKDAGLWRLGDLLTADPTTGPAAGASTAAGAGRGVAR